MLSSRVQRTPFGLRTGSYTSAAGKPAPQFDDPVAGLRIPGLYAGTNELTQTVQKPGLAFPSIAACCVALSAAPSGVAKYLLASKPQSLISSSMATWS